MAADRRAGARRRTIDLNADVGECDDPADVDGALVATVSSVNVACGFHAGGPEVMLAVVAAAVEAGTVVGAHPSYADREGFGRRHLDVPPERLYADVLYQVGALQAVAHACGTRLAHVKPHGALYHRLRHDPDAGRAVVRAVAAFGPHPPALVVAARPSAHRPPEWLAGVPTVAEAFVDRAYDGEGELVGRDRPGALVTDPDVAAARALSLALDGGLEAADGTWLDLDARTLCVHGDTPGAADIARAVRAALEAAGVRVGPPA